jgi:hypothetical protein
MLSKLQAKMHIKLDLINITVYCWIVKTVTKTIKPRLIRAIIWRDGTGKIPKYPISRLNAYSFGWHHHPTPLRLLGEGHQYEKASNTKKPAIRKYFRSYTTKYDILNPQQPNF